MLRPLLLTLALTLPLAACAGGTADPAGLPAADGDAADAPVSQHMCVEDEPDCQDMVTAPVCAPSSTEECDDTEVIGADPAAGSCLVGDESCTDESHDGQDVSRPVPLADAPSGAEPAGRGATSGATGHVIEHAYLVDEDTLELTIGDNPCMLVEDVLVTESPEEVRVLVLAGQDATVDACIEPYVQFTVTVDLASPLGDRTVLDLAG